jgi:hypothetical protein
MAKEIICVYQDCPMCGDRGKQLKKIIIDKKLNVRKVSFASEEGKDLIHEAVFNHGIGTMPFFTDGTKFSTSIEELAAKPKKKKGDKK